MRPGDPLTVNFHFAGSMKPPWAIPDAGGAYPEMERFGFVLKILFCILFQCETHLLHPSILYDCDFHDVSPTFPPKCALLHRITPVRDWSAFLYERVSPATPSFAQVSSSLYPDSDHGWYVGGPLLGYAVSRWTVFLWLPLPGELPGPVQMIANDRSPLDQIVGRWFDE